MKTNQTTMLQTNKIAPFKRNHVNGFVILSYSINNKLLTKDLLSAHIKSFWIFALNKISFYALFITNEYKDGVFKSSGKASKITHKDLDRYIKIMLGQLDFKDNQYFENRVVAIHFWYKSINKKLLTNKESVIHEAVNKYTLTTTKTFGFNLPNNMYILSWVK